MSRDNLNNKLTKIIDATAIVINPTSYAKGINRETFQKYDGDGDGFLSKTELQKYFNDKYAKAWVEAHAEQCYTDMNGDGKLSYGELILIANGKNDITFEDFCKKYGEIEARDYFKTYDLNGDNKVTAEEVAAVDNAKNAELSNSKTDAQENKQSKGLSTAAIIGIVVAAVCAVVLLVGLIVYLSRNKDKDKNKEANKEKGNTGNSFDKERKDVGYNVSNDLHSINQSKERQV